MVTPNREKPEEEEEDTLYLMLFFSFILVLQATDCQYITLFDNLSSLTGK